MTDTADKPPHPTLHHLTSSASFRVLWAFEELAIEHGVTYSLKIYPRALELVELKKVFPLGVSPTLTFDNPASTDKTNDTRPLTVEDMPHRGMQESRLILRYLADTYSKGMWDPATPEDAYRTAYFDQFSATLGGRIDLPLMLEMIHVAMPWFLRPVLGLLFSPIVQVLVTRLSPFFELMESSLTEEKPWFSGARMGIADFSMSFPMDMAAARKYFDPKKYPKLAAWHKSVQSRPAYKSALEKGGIYDLVKFV